MRIEKLVEVMKNVKAPRRKYGNLRHNLATILVIGFLTTVCGGEDFTDMEDFGKERKEWLQTFIELPNGIPDSDTFRRVFERVNPQELAENLRDWLDLHKEKNSVVSIDGKTICGSKNSEHKAYHVVSAFVSENRITLGEIKTDEKSNEIKAIPELLEMIDINGATVTIDAMGCQTKIAAKIIEKKADYVLALKENQENLYNEASSHFEKFANETAKTTTNDKGHGRVEMREYFLETCIDWLPKKSLWQGISAIGLVKSTVFEKDKTRSQSRFFLTSLTEIDDFAKAVRSHWTIENQLHWCLDVSFREDDSRARKDNSPLNLNVLRKTALPLLNAADFGRIGIKKKMFRAALSISSLNYILTGKK